MLEQIKGNSERIYGGALMFDVAHDSPSGLARP
jgi:hypothetical protein